MEEKEEYYTSNGIASIIKWLAVFAEIIISLGSIIAGVSSDNFIIAIIGFSVSMASAIMLYAVGELIEIMHDIRTNTEHLRDYIEKEKR